MSRTTYSNYQSENFIFDHARQTNSNDIPFHSHSVYELLFIKKGAASYIIGGKTYPLSKNCLLIARPSERHAIKSDPSSEYERYDIFFSPDVFSPEIYSKLSEDISVINYDGKLFVSDLFKKMDYYCENFEGKPLRTLLLHLTEEVIYNVILSSRNQELNDTYAVNPIINKALKYIDDNITAPLDLNTICDELYITRSHLHHLFVKHLQISPKKYIVSQKLMLAQSRLRSGSKPTEVYSSCGFGDYTSFYRDYKNYFGYAPSEESKLQIVKEIMS